MSKEDVKKAVDKVNDYHDKSWQEDHFHEDQAEWSLNALRNLKTSDDFDKAFNELSDDTRKDLANSLSEKVEKDEKNKTLIRALLDGDPSKYSDALRLKEVKFDKGSGLLDPIDEGKHQEIVRLNVPEGYSQKLLALIKETQFVMQWGFDSIGTRTPKDAPDFAAILTDSGIESPEGWADTVKNYDDLAKNLKDRQEKYSDSHKEVDIATVKAKDDGYQVISNLTKIKDDLNKHLSRSFTPEADPNKKKAHTTLEDGKIIYHNPKDSKNPEQTVYTENKDGVFHLTPEAEQIYYVHFIDKAVEDWNKEYQHAVEKFQEGAKKVDNTDDDPPTSKEREKEKTDAYNRGYKEGKGSVKGGGGSGNTATPTPASGTPETPAAETPTADAGAKDTEPQDFSDLFPELGDDTDPEASTEKTGADTGGSTDPFDDVLGNTDDANDADDPTDVSAKIDDAIATITDSAGSTDSGSESSAPSGATASPASFPSWMNPANSASGPFNSTMNPNGAPSQWGQNGSTFGGPLGGSGSDSGSGGAGRNPMLNIPGATAQPVSEQQPASAVSADPITSTGAPSPHSMVDMKYSPDDSDSQKVTSAVSQAVHRELNNNSTDGLAAYGNSLGNLQQVGSSQLHTGDIIRWQNGSAIIAFKGAEPYIIIDGDWKPIDPGNPPTGPYGDFQGFFRPDAAVPADNGRSAENVQASAAGTAGVPPTGSTAARRV